MKNRKISILHWVVSPFSTKSYGGLEFIENYLLNIKSKNYKFELFSKDLVNGDRRAGSNIKLIRHFEFLMKYDVFYYLSFIKKTNNSFLRIGFNSPILSLLDNSGKSVVWFQNQIGFFGKMTYLPFYSLFKNRYKKSHFIFCSKYLLNSFCCFYPDFPKKNLHLIYNFTDLAINTKKKIVKSKYFKIIYIGQINYEKGFDTLINACDFLYKKNFPFNLHIIGSKRLWNNKKIINLNLSDKKYIKSYKQVKHSAIGGYLKDKDVLIVPSKWDEPFGIVAVEGLSAGLIVISSQKGGLSEIIEDGRNGLSFKPNNHIDLANKILQVYEMNDLQKYKLINSGFAKVRALFNEYKFKKDFFKLVNNFQ